MFQEMMRNAASAIRIIAPWQDAASRAALGLVEVYCHHHPLTGPFSVCLLDLAACGPAPGIGSVVAVVGRESAASAASPLTEVPRQALKRSSPTLRVIVGGLLVKKEIMHDDNLGSFAIGLDLDRDEALSHISFGGLPPARVNQPPRWADFAAYP